MSLSPESKAREDICRVSKSLFDRGFVHATAGNISVMLDDGFLITPTDACLGFLDPNTLAKVDRDLHQISGERASKTIALHAAIYRASASYSTKASCIIHTHSTHCVALSLRAIGAELVPPLTPYFVMKVGHVPIVNYHRPGEANTAAEVERIIHQYGQQAQPIRAVMLPRLGPNVWSGNPLSAMAVLEELEETAKLACLQAATVPLTDAQIEELRQAFGAIW